MPPRLAQVPSFEVAMCSVSWPKLIDSGVGLNPNLSSGMSLAAATILLAELLTVDLSAVVNGLAAWADDPSGHTARHSAMRLALSRTFRGDFISGSPKTQAAAFA